MDIMKLDNHLDPDLFDVFVNEKVYEAFAKEHLQPSQIDEFNINDIPGCGDFDC